MPRVLIQKGHVSPREPGFEAGTGTFREQEFVSLVATELERLLRLDGRFKPVVVPGDIPDGIKVDVALFLHGDGSADQSASGYCFGYPEGYLVNRELAQRISAEFQKIPGHPPKGLDNYTGALRGYYGFSRVNTEGPEVLIEHGFLTNPAERLWLFGHVKELAYAEYVAVCGYYGWKPRGSWPKPLPAWFWPWAEWRLGEGSYSDFGPKNGPRPTNAPRLIPLWAWLRLGALLRARKG